MHKFLIKWKVNPHLMPADPEECIKALQSMNEGVKALIVSKQLEDWGEYCDGSGGYSIVNADDIIALHSNLISYWPYVEMDAKPVLTIDQVIESTNRLIREVKSK